MIFGIGADIVRVSRMDEALLRHGERFARKILAEEEWQGYLANARPAFYLAKRFAAKEAMVKALGTGFRHGFGLRHIAVYHDRLGKPGLRFAPDIQQRLSEMGAGEVLLTLSDEEDLALAFVVLLRAYTSVEPRNRLC